MKSKKKKKEKELDCDQLSRTMDGERGWRKRERKKPIIHIGVKFQIFETRKDRVAGNRKRINEGNRAARNNQVSRRRIERVERKAMKIGWKIKAFALLTNHG